jgi:hypothetical protein
MPAKRDIDFLVIGCQKCGTSTLHHWLNKEKKVSLPKQKETHFFSHDDKYAKGYDWYYSQFDEKPNCMYGEVDPEYIYWKNAATRINKLNKKPKIIILLRDPTERMISQFQMSVRRAIEPLTLQEAINNSTKRKKDNKENYYKHYSYIERSLYKEQIESFQSKYDGNEYLFVLFEELFSESAYEQYNRICEFLGFKTSLKKNDLKERKNKRSSPKFPFINKILWDKKKYKFFRKITALILTSKTRQSLHRIIYEKNTKTEFEHEIKTTKIELPKDLIRKFESEKIFIENLTRK